MRRGVVGEALGTERHETGGELTELGDGRLGMVETRHFGRIVLGELEGGLDADWTLVRIGLYGG